jgi:hypothetical protein
MNDEQKDKILLLSGVVVLFLLFMLVIWSWPGRGPAKVGEPSRSEGFHRQVFERPTRPVVGQAPSSPVRSAPAGEIRGSPEAQAAREAHQVKMQKEAIEWLEKYVNDPTVSSFTRELYAARNHPDIQAGVFYLYDGQETKAAEEFERAALDQNNRVSVRFIAIRQRYFIARNQKNFEDYFKWGRMLGEMLRDHDLSHFDQEIGPTFLNRIREQEYYYKARNNESLQEELARYIVTNKKGFDLSLAREEVKRQIGKVEQEFGI